MKASHQKNTVKSKPLQSPAQQRGRATHQSACFADNRPQALNQAAIQQMADTSPRGDEITQLQAKAEGERPNRTGLPDSLKAGVENLSGYSLDDVKVHYNSNRPAQLQAHAYAQGTDIHLGPGQEKHLPHEVWHVVQQKQGRVRPTLQMKGGVSVNDDSSLEKEADTMGQLAGQSVPLRLPARNILQARFHSSHVFQLVPVSLGDVGKYYSIVRDDNGANDTGRLASIDGGGWYTFDDVSGDNGVRVRGQSNIIQEVSSPSTPMFSVGGISFQNPINFGFTSTSALNATKPLAHGTWGQLTGQKANSGVSIGDYGSYGGIQYLEQTGDGLTGDHQPSGAAIKEAIRLELHRSLNQVLTRGMARIAYQKAITVVVTEVWHRASSRTYGGRNTPNQISDDAKDLMQAAISDWEKTVPHLQSEGFSNQEISDIWDGLNELREEFFKTGDPQFPK
ncbi:eCIS core domain-containing protein [Parapedobacter pyrenivorans]|uniref:eCIS core domain-containing protein n=1 Tax=Parapedobacter pyrenivorans TaxID=1305674 RepID=UPI00333ECE84